MMLDKVLIVTIMRLLFRGRQEGKGVAWLVAGRGMGWASCFTGAICMQWSAICYHGYSGGEILRHINWTFISPYSFTKMRLH